MMTKTEAQEILAASFRASPKQIRYLAEIYIHSLEPKKPRPWRDCLKAYGRADLLLPNRDLVNTYDKNQKEEIV
jgi:hypothetical protein